ncbi:threonine aldolase family protein [Bifidobacterium avesanii]|uniref:Aminotransferase class I/II-fold pyridoxal phosphate-dependent enzyme n=1 Tax=Bifidobacterium avesanii TaxID=1798157 RepID=A0A7K3TGY7_9BIFI|nr:aminotransferase class I/II-fold pyridoxal phosphate-dependent enzyme [Bifidobacterium avesanii]KAB8291491.1 beta-eliminating lyase [Bifidobacterium avesanii]NEG77880.1 aminotransferase class I/II-fold pyridoxal phosphate-dependent enzyme [Bifidobacterium avesanii]
MLSFENDYSEGAHPAILERIAKANMDQYPGYGSDAICESAKAKIREACGDADAEVFFLVGGTQTNQVVIDSMLSEVEGVVAVDTGHVNVHEAGAIEATGHKVLTLPAHDGKMDAGELDAYCAAFMADGNRDHMVWPGMVYVSHPTEYGTLYTKAELGALHAVCGKYGIPLFVDGARLGYGLTARGADVTMADLARLADVFYVGGTKVGALMGEAVVFTHRNMPRHFLTIVKRHGALLAKGFLLGIQFDTLFTDGLYTAIARHANEQADRIREALTAKGYVMPLVNTTNQIFVTLSDERYRELTAKVRLGFWEKPDAEHTTVRIATSWATTDEHVDELIALL